MNSSYSGSTYDVVPGIGLNLSNALPTTTLNQLAKGMNPPLKDFTPEKLLASILAHFEVSRLLGYRKIAEDDGVLTKSFLFRAYRHCTRRSARRVSTATWSRTTMRTGCILISL